MIVINLSYLNASNGMFWYAMDKIKTLDEGAVDYVVMVKAELAPLARRELPRAVIHESTKLKSTMQILRRKALRRSPLRVVTFTSHPIPFLADQTIAFYDDYPFAGRMGVIKRLLFTVAARSSKCRVGIINRSLALPFLKRCGIPECRIFFDSAFPAMDVRDVGARSATPASPPRVGLVGTDSRKKNYAAIFDAVMTLGVHHDLRFLVYGSDNDYARALRQDFKDVDFTIVSSDQIDIPQFFEGIDYLVSASRAEGYGRPMGLAVMLGVPLFLLESPVFMEFFADHAHFFDNVPEMLRYIVDVRPPAATAVSSDLSIIASRSPFFE